MPRTGTHDSPLRLPALALLWSLVLVAVACTGGGGSPAKKATAQMVEVKDHIVSMDVSSSIDANGQPVGPAFTFDPTAKQITVLAHVGILTGDPQLIFTWSESTSNGDKELFSQAVQVKSRDVVFSVGKSPGTIAVGTYKITATLGGETKTIQVDVNAPLPSGTTTDSSSAASSSGNQGSTSAGPPVSGISGAVSQSAPAPPSDSAGLVSDVFVDHTAAQDHLGWYYNVDTTDPASYAGDFTLQVNGGSPVSMGRVQGTTVLKPSPGPNTVQQFHAGVQSEWEIVPCDVPGGSDLPGTRLVVKETTHSSYGQESAQASAVLGSDTEAPRLPATSDPSNGDRVKAGDIITFHLTAVELRGEGNPWQTGVKQISILGASGQGDVVTPQTYGDTALPCDQKSWTQTATFTYTVPENPPSIVRLFPYTVDFAGNVHAHEFDFPTAETWTGTMSLAGFTRDSVGTVCTEPGTNFTISFTSTPDGAVQGKGRYHGPPYVCVTKLGGVSTPPDRGTFTIAGRRTNDQFLLRMTSVSGSKWFGAFWPYSLRGWTLPIQGELVHTVILGPSLGQTLPGHVALTVDLTCSGCTIGSS
jgi:hypothetical protein